LLCRTATDHKTCRVKFELVINLKTAKVLGLDWASMPTGKFWPCSISDVSNPYSNAQSRQDVFNATDGG